MPQTAKSKSKYVFRCESDYTEVATLLCGYVQKVCWILRNNFHLTAYKSILIRLCCQRIYYFEYMQVLVHVNTDEDMSMHTCHLYCYMLIQQDVG